MSVKRVPVTASVSQYGADYLARAGKTYEEILKTYYTGVEIEKQVKLHKNDTKICDLKKI